MGIVSLKLRLSKLFAFFNSNFSSFLVFSPLLFILHLIIVLLLIFIFPAFCFTPPYLLFSQDLCTSAHNYLTSAEAPLPGDIVFTQLGASDPDRFEFVTLKRLNLSTLFITDNPVRADKTLGTTEGTISLADSMYLLLRDIEAGTFIRFEKGSGTNDTDPSDRVLAFFHSSNIQLAASGDQLIAYTGSASAPVFIAAADFGNSGWISSGTTTSNTSYAPGSLSDFYAGSLGNYRFKGRVDMGLISTRNYIKNPTNWEGSSAALAFTLKNIGVQYLPVVLTSFKAELKDHNVLLHWITATEINNYGWDIERKTGTEDWQKIGFLAGSGNSNAPKQYHFTDNSPLKGRTLFYRLKQIDINGLTEYSRIIEVDVPFTDGFYLKQNYPNPFNNSTVISYSLTEESLVSLKLYNISGEEIYSFINQKQLPGEYQFRLDVSNISSKKPLSSGIYIYKLQAGSRSIFKKLIFLK